MVLLGQQEKLIAGIETYANIAIFEITYGE